MIEKSSAKKILVLGATGRTGIHVVTYALTMGYEVVAFVRKPESLKTSHPKLMVVEGDTENLNDVRKAVSMVDAVISVINNPRTSDNPWSKVIGQRFMMRDSMKNVVAAMKEHGKRRILIMSTFGAGESFGDLPWIVRMLVRFSNMKVAFDDHTGQENVLKDSDLDWTVVRCVQLSNDEKQGSLIVSTNNIPKPESFISRTTVALFLVDQLENPKFVHALPVISQKQITGESGIF